MYLTFLASLAIILVLAIQSLASPLLAHRGSEEALENIHYLTISWQTYTTSLLNISHIYHVPIHHHHHNSQPQYNTSLLPLDAQYAVIAVASAYNMNFRYENYVIDRIKQGPVLGTNDGRAVVKAIKELLGALKPLFETFGVFVDVVGKDNLRSMLEESYQGQIGLLIDAVEEVVGNGQKGKVEKLGRKHIEIVAGLKEDLVV